MVVQLGGIGNLGMWGSEKMLTSGWIAQSPNSDHRASGVGKRADEWQSSCLASMMYESHPQHCPEQRCCLGAAGATTKMHCLWYIPGMREHSNKGLALPLSMAMNVYERNATGLGDSIVARVHALHAPEPGLKAS